MKNRPKKVALVLSGGGVKAAAFHLGVCLALKEKGFRFAGGTRESLKQSHPHLTTHGDDKVIRLYVGSSAGSFVSALLASGYSPEALINAFSLGLGLKPRYSDEYSLGHLKPIRYRNIFSMNGPGLLRSLTTLPFGKRLGFGGFESMLKERFRFNGFFTTKALEKYLRTYALPSNDFAKLGVELFVVGTQLNHTRKTIFGAFNETIKSPQLMQVHDATISDAVAASTSLPPVFAPYGIKRSDGKTIFYFDGEIRDTLSTHVATDHGADLVISSYSVHPYHFNSKIGSLHRYGFPMILNQALYQVIQQKIDRHVRHIEELKDIHTMIDAYFKNHGLPADHRERLLHLFRQKTGCSPEVEHMYIHPRPQDHEMFFADHFSLNPHILEKIVRIGFKSTLSSLRMFDSHRVA